MRLPILAIAMLILGPLGAGADALESIRVNCGGAAFTNAAGQAFAADQEYTEELGWGYVRGRSGRAPDGAFPDSTPDAPLWSTERWGVEKYVFHVKPGLYRVSLYFTEYHFSAPNKRLFNVYLNDQHFVSRLDIFAAAGGRGKPLVLSRVLRSEDGLLEVSVEELRDKAKFSALAIEPIEPDDVAPPAPTQLTSYPRGAETGLDWKPPEAEDLAGYHIYRSGSITGDFVRVGSNASPYWIDRDTTLSGSVCYAVSAADLFGNEGERCAPIEVAAGSTAGRPEALGLNVGGPQLTDERGRFFLADREYNPGNAAGYITPGIPLDLPRGLYQEPYRSMREGAMRYRLDLPPGPYRVTLGFFDPFSRESKSRLFSVMLNGYQVMDSFDLFEQYGGRLPAEEQRFGVVDTNGLEIILQPVHGEPLLSYVYAAPALEPDTNAPAAPVFQPVRARDEVVCLDWTASNEPDVIGYQVLRSVGGPEAFEPLSNGWIGLTRFVDRDVRNDEVYFYQVVAHDAFGRVSAPAALVEARPHFPSDDELLDQISRGAFEFFLRQHDASTYLTRDKNTAATISVAATGFGLSALCIGAERGWIGRAEAERRAYLMLRALNGIDDNKAQGIFFHYLKGDGSHGGGGYEDVTSTVDAALLAFGAISAGEYFGGRIREEADLMISRMNWKFYADQNRRLITMAYHPSNGRFDGAWDYYTDEALLIVLLGIGAPHHEFQLDPTYFYTFRRDRKSYADIQDIVCTWPGAFFTYCFAHCWIDFRQLGPDQPEKAGMPAALQVDWWTNSIKAAQANKAFCLSLTNQFRTFGENAWGLTACSGPGDEYMVCGAPPSGGGIETGGGTLALYGAGMAVPFLPDDAIAALRHYYSLKDDAGRKLLWKDEFDGGYGLVDAFNLDKAWVSGEIHGINHGPMLLMIENYRSGLIWRLMLKNQTLRTALERVGFRLQSED